MDIQKEKKAIKNLKAFYMEDCNLTEEERDDLDNLVSRIVAVVKTEAQAVPEGFVVVSQKDLLELTIAINAVDLATHTESKTNEVREMWQQVALKLMALGISQEPAND